MMNVLSLCLVVSSLAAAGVWSPTPEKPTRNDDVLVKEGHRVVVIEYDQEGQHNTKVSISPEQDSHHQDHHKTILDDAKDRIKDAASVLPNVGQGVSSDGHIGHGPRELICDAYGKCKHKITSAIGKAKDKASDAVNQNIERAHEAKEAVNDAVGKAKETVSEKAHEIEENAKGRYENAKESVKSAKEAVTEQAEEIREDIAEKAKQSKEKVKNRVEKSAQQVFGLLTKRMGLPATLDSMMGVLNLVGLAMAYGMCMWVTFVSSHVLAGALPRQQFGVVQSKIYPVYFRAMSYSIGLALLGHLLGHRKRLLSDVNKAEMFQVYNLLGSLLMVLANSLYLEPRATKAMFERMKMEKEEGRGRESLIPDPSESRPVGDPAATTTPPPPKSAEHEAARAEASRLSDRLKKLNTSSSFLNILTLMALTWHLVYLGKCIHVAC